MTNMDKASTTQTKTSRLRELLATRTLAIPGAFNALVALYLLAPVFAPDVSGSLDGHIPDDWLGTTLGGTPLEAIRGMVTKGAFSAVVTAQPVACASAPVQSLCRN